MSDTLKETTPRPLGVLPWRFVEPHLIEDDDGEIVARVAGLFSRRHANSDLIVAAVNDYERLLGIESAARALCDDEESGVDGFGPDVTHILPLRAALDARP